MSFEQHSDVLNRIFVAFIPSVESKTDKDGTRRYKKPKFANWQNLTLPLDACLTKEKNYGGAVREGYICVDADTENDAAMLLRIVDAYKLKTLTIKTKNGMHFYFRDSKHQIVKNDVKAVTPLNVIVDYRISGGFVILKEFGVEREIIRSVTGELDELPMYLVGHHNCKSTKDGFTAKFIGGNSYDFPTLANSEDWSLHNTLRDYMLVLAKNGYKNDENIKTIIRAINKGMTQPQDEKLIEAELLKDFSKVHEISTIQEFNNYKSSQGSTVNEVCRAINYYNTINNGNSFVAYKSGRGVYDIVKDTTGNYNEDVLKFNALKSKLTTFKYTWLAGETKDGVPIHEQPNNDVFRAVCDSGEQDLNMPKYKTISNGAFLTKEGRLVNKFGLDNETGVFITKNVMVPTIPETPNDIEIKRAKDTIMTILQEFAFEREEQDLLEDNINYQNTVFELISAIFRPAWVGAYPIWVISKNSERVGASLLSDVISRLAYDKNANISSVSIREDENEKIVQSLIIGNPCYQVFDNITTKTNWVTPTLLTASSGAGSFSFRQLGTAKTIIAERSTMWVMNGINVNITADVTGRVVVTKLSTPKAWQEMKFTRTRDELLRLAEKYHPRIIWSIGVLLNNWIALGNPAPPKLKGNFSEYTQLYNFIGGMMYVVGYTNVLGNLTQIQEEENEAEITGCKLMKVLAERFPDGKFSTSDIINQMKTEAFQHVTICDYDYDMDISSLLLTENEIKMVENMSAKKIGMLLKQHVNRAYSGATHKLIQIKVHGSNVYKLTSILG